MLKEHGMIHMSIPKIAQAAGIGTGTFYRFFSSKEEYVYQMILHRRQLLLSEVMPMEVKAGERKLNKDEVRKLLALMVDKDKSVYANLSLEDESKLFKNVDTLSPDISHEKEVSSGFLGLIEGQKESLDFPVLANLMKVLAITSQAREELHEEGYDRTIEIIIDSIMGELYE